MFLSLILAAAKNGVIGNKGKLPWDLPDDLKYFREKTKGHAMIMGRKTFESIGRLLPDRLNIVVSLRGMQEGTAMTQEHKNLCIVSSFEGALRIAEGHQEEEVFVIGGGQLFFLAYPVAQRIYLTQIHATVEGDTYFLPLLTPSWEREWKEVSREEHPIDGRHAYPFTFLLFERR